MKSNLDKLNGGVEKLDTTSPLPSFYASFSFFCFLFSFLQHLRWNWDTNTPGLDLQKVELNTAKGSSDWQDTRGAQLAGNACL